MALSATSPSSPCCAISASFSVIPLSAGEGKLPTALRDIEGVPEFAGQQHKKENPEADKD